MRTPATRQHWISRDKHMCSPTFQKLTFRYRRAFISSVWWRIHSRSQLLWSTISRLYDSFSVRPISYRVLVWPVSTRVSMTFSSWVSEQETKKNNWTRHDHGCPAEELRPSRTHMDVWPAFLCPFSPCENSCVRRSSGSLPLLRCCACLRRFFFAYMYMEKEQITHPWINKLTISHFCT